MKHRQMQSTDKKYQGVNRLCFFMPKIFAFLFLPWRHKPLLLSHNHLHCRCQEELQLGEGDPFSRRSLCSRILALLRGQTTSSPLIHTRESQNLLDKRVSCRTGRDGAPQRYIGCSPHGSPRPSAWILTRSGWNCERQSCQNLSPRTRASAACWRQQPLDQHSREKEAAAAFLKLPSESNS